MNEVVYINKEMIWYIIMNTTLSLYDIKELRNEQIIKLLKELGYYDN